MGDTEGVVHGTPTMEQYLRKTGQTKALNALLLKKHALRLRKHARARHRESPFEAQAMKSAKILEANKEPLSPGQQPTDMIKSEIGRDTGLPRRHDQDNL